MGWRMFLMFVIFDYVIIVYTWLALKEVCPVSFPHSHGMRVLIGFNRYHNTRWKRCNRFLVVSRGRTTLKVVPSIKSMRNQPRQRSKWDLKTGKNTLVLRLVGIRIQLARRVPFAPFWFLHYSRILPLESGPSYQCQHSKVYSMECMPLWIRLFTTIHKHETLIRPQLRLLPHRLRRFLDHRDLWLRIGELPRLSAPRRRENSGEQLLALRAALNIARPSRITFSEIAAEGIQELFLLLGWQSNVGKDSGRFLS